MRCGAKCFLVEIEKDSGERETIPVNARTFASARKIVRETFGSDLAIMKVKEQRREQ